MAKKITLSAALNNLNDQQISKMVEITTPYLRNKELTEHIIRQHIEHAPNIRLAYMEDRLVGYAIASKHKIKTPFFPKPINTLFHRMLIIDTDVLFQGLGKKLIWTTMRDLFGQFWLCKRMAIFCRTENPVVAKLMNMCNIVYPQYGEPIPEEIKAFSRSLLPLIGEEQLDENNVLSQTLIKLKGEDYTDIWNHYLHRSNNEYEKLMLSTTFKKKNDRIIYQGSTILLVGYAKPFNFIGEVLKSKL